MKNYIFTLLISIVLFSCKNEGCTDPLAINFDDSSNKNDGSCEYLYNLDIRFSLNDNDTKLVKNDIIILLKCGHGFKIEKNCKFIEVKQGPFDPKQDKFKF